MSTQPSLIIHFFIYSSLFYLIYLGFGKPHQLPFQWRLELINEFMLLESFYFFVLYTGLIHDRETLDMVGTWHIVLLGFLFLVNLVVIVCIVVSDLSFKLRIRKLKSEHK